MLDITRRQVLLILVGVLAVSTMVAGVYGLVRQPAARPAANGHPAGIDAEAIEVESDESPAQEDRSLPRTSDPITYARAVATSLFNWDTTAGLLPVDYTAAVLADTDPSGEETPGLLTDVATYLPSIEQWLDLATMNVTQTLSIEQAFVPHSWAAALEQARGHLRPGTTAVTITGTRHREGIWEGEPAETSYPVAFTVFVACPPAFERCHVLRLSQLDNPLK
ncbi:hypothetical protein EXE58_18975 [Nocardioides seonyuensis]|uniref:Uncharacterized protein n=1 Tax=Nocardioides seonyuensis TaxID=2518371 RepID=A0A4P7IKB7_9ACTN|nr:hypothetical protein [Nocardioides seonyuensis]QBX57303.1 hypothetical protein EXE58_18975 [Nocardioides seonyuensis]